MNRPLSYIAAPYSHEDPLVIQHRMEVLYRVMGAYIGAEEHVLTPLFMHEVVVRHDDMEGDYNFWERYCLNILKRCDQMIVVMLEGWDKSRGVAGEIAFCKEHNIPVIYIDPIDLL